MDKIAGLRQKLGQTKDRRNAVIDKALEEQRGLTTEEETQVAGLETEIKGLEKTIELAEKQQAEAAKDAKPLGTAAAPNGNVTEPKREKGAGIARIIRSLAATKGDTY